MSDDETFHIKVDGGPEQTITVKTGKYRDAAAAVPALLGLDLPLLVEIWCPRLLPTYGPYLYQIAENRFGGLETEAMILSPRRPAGSADLYGVPRAEE